MYLNATDTICVIMTSNAACPDPKADTACSIVTVLTGVDEVNAAQALQLYPNPNDGNFTLNAQGVYSASKIEIVNAVGQVVYTKQVQPKQGRIHEAIKTEGIATGLYLLKLYEGENIQVLRFTVK